MISFSSSKQNQMKIRLPMGNFKQNNNNLFLEQTKQIKIRIQNGNLT